MQKYTLIGHPLGHSMSPFIHDELFKISGIEAEYDCTDIPAENFADRMNDLRKLNGYNITIPYKRDIIPYVDELDASAKRYNSVNCVHNRDGKAVGYNTDCDGFLLSVKAKNLNLSGRVLLAGCGGVGRMMAIEAALHGAELTIGIIPEAAQAAAALTDEIHFLAPDSKIYVKLIDSINGSFDLIVNATPVGMYPKTDACPVSTELIGRCGGVFDAVYNPVKTKLLQIAESFGKTAVNGTAMLVYQAVKAHEIWNGSSYTEAQVQEIIEKTNKIIAGEFK
ncbi:shikimate dehydrogenase [Ruminococcus sp. HUN007]|jgi:shikimate dehydrogenase|uniref:shikimate dehydrogenase family protein n=1 Tax=Ruminococcus sp. HUN007 TaxID=1514668 RepID=UPI0005D1FEEE|nr:shikimate dehydrogenase [Ruminococcus sp. HUN007]